MTVKQIALLTKKPGMARDDFIRRYEEGHVPLISRIIPFFDAYRRNFVLPETLPRPAHFETAPPPIGFDVVTELWFSDATALANLFRTVSTTDAGARIDEDETHFLDRSRMMMMMVDERRTAREALAPAPGGATGRPLYKFCVFVTRRTDQSRADFIDYYENRHAPLALRLLQRDGAPLFADYARNYPDPDNCFAIGERQGPLPVPCDCITEYSFWSEADWNHFLHLCTQEDVAGPLAEDEARLNNGFRMARVEEHVSQVTAPVA